MVEEQYGSNCILIVNSPFQLLCANEIIKLKKIKNYILVVFYEKNNLNNLYQINASSRFLNLKIHKCIDISLKKLSYFKLIYFLLFKNTNFLILGGFFNSKFNFSKKLINYNNLIYVDDGTATYFLEKENFNKNVEVYSIFKSLNHFKFNRMNFIKTFTKNKKYDNRVILLGTNSVESGDMTFVKYLQKINKIKSLFENVIYIPHRRENIANVQKYNLKTLQIDTCFEIFLAQCYTIPSTIIGFYSTALITTKILLNSDSNVKIFNIPISFKEAELKKVYSKIFFEYKIKDIDI